VNHKPDCNSEGTLGDCYHNIISPNTTLRRWFHYSLVFSSFDTSNPYVGPMQAHAPSPSPPPPAPAAAPCPSLSSPSPSLPSPSPSLSSPSPTPAPRTPSRQAPPPLPDAPRGGPATPAVPHVPPIPPAAGAAAAWGAWPLPHRGSPAIAERRSCDATTCALGAAALAQATRPAH
jgi:hypothetical protein